MLGEYRGVEIQASRASVSPRMVSEVEHGHRQSLMAESLLGLAEALGGGPHWLLYGLGSGEMEKVVGGIAPSAGASQSASHRPTKCPTPL